MDKRNRFRIKLFDGITFDVYENFTLEHISESNNVCFFSKNRGAVALYHCGEYIIKYKKDKIKCKVCEKVWNISPKHLKFMAKMALFGK